MNPKHQTLNLRMKRFGFVRFENTLAQGIETLKKIQTAHQRLQDAATSPDVTALKGAFEEARPSHTSI